MHAQAALTACTSRLVEHGRRASDAGPALPALQLPKLPLPPPFEEGWKLQDGVAITRDLYDTLVLMVRGPGSGWGLRFVTRRSRPLFSSAWTVPWTLQSSAHVHQQQHWTPDGLGLAGGGAERARRQAVLDPPF